MNTCKGMDINKIQPDIARIDIERSGQTMLFVRAWKKGFNPDDAGSPAFEDLIDAISMTQVCAALEAQGFSVTMTSAAQARALRGEVTRVDFVKQTDGWHIKKYPHGWRASTRPMSDVVKSEDEINAAIHWCKEHGWTVRENPGLSRAWKGKPLPVRTAEAIRQIRTKATPEQRFANFLYDF
ncbi:MAG: hypothetical protein PHQ36_07585 [Anaerolineales bacterium]|nr:hypothetical protein [Anaerolineales bacterium]